MKTTLIKYRKWIFILLYPGVVMADIYQKKDNNGVVEFSDNPSSNASLVTLKPVNIYTPHLLNNDGLPKNTSNLTENFYKKIEIVQPIDQTTFQNQKDIIAKLSMEPSLKSGDKIEWVLDENLYQRSRELEIHFVSLDRGEHRLEANIINDQNKALLSSETVNFYVHQPMIRSEK